MDTYLILRRSGWRTPDEFAEADSRSTAEGENRVDELARIRSYALDERDSSIGSVCIFQAAGPEALRRHAAAAGLPVDEIVKVAGTVIVRPDPEPTPPRERKE